MKPSETLKAINELRAQRARVQENIEKAGPAIEAAATALNKALNNLQEVEAAFMRGLSTEQAVLSARQSVEDARRVQSEAQRSGKTANAVISEVDSEIAQACAAHETALRRRSDELIAPIKARVHGDKKIRAALLEIFGLVAASSSQAGVVDWDSIVSDCFPWPNDSEAAAAVDSARKAVMV